MLFPLIIEFSSTHSYRRECCSLEPLQDQQSQESLLVPTIETKLYQLEESTFKNSEISFKIGRIDETTIDNRREVKVRTNLLLHNPGKI